jgi:hypothetical protein
LIDASDCSLWLSHFGHLKTILVSSSLFIALPFLPGTLPFWPAPDLVSFVLGIVHSVSTAGADGRHASAVNAAHAAAMQPQQQ